ncbi:UPF0146 family protein [Natronorarus salvus]|uniref:UPF0146 family protein n=1 Tax=Natronorarus salvus TaxID=3117733 RepID=UPI002F267A35
MQDATRYALCDALSAYDPLVEVGIGRRPGVAAALAGRGHAVTATDVVERAVPEGVRFVRDDVTEPRTEIYADAAALYALNAPPELHRPIRDLAREVGAAFRFTTLGTDPPTVPAETRTLPEETLYLATEGPG